MKTVLVLIWCIMFSDLAIAQSDRISPTPFPEVQLYVNNVPVNFVSPIVSPLTIIAENRIPALMVQDHVMLPVRFFAEVLGNHLDLHLDQWGIVQIGNPDEPVYAFKIGKRTAYTSAPMIGGDVPVPVDLPVAPMVINNRLYVPAMPTLLLFGHSAQWKPETKSLWITEKPEETQ